MNLGKPPISNSVNYLTAVFEFDEEWSDFEKIATFENCDGCWQVSLEGDACVIPWEVLTGADFCVSVHGISEDVRVTTNKSRVSLAASGYKEGETPKPPTPDVYSQLLNTVNDLSDAIGDINILLENRLEGVA